VLQRAAQRAGDAQSHNHAIVSEGESGLIGWCLEAGGGTAYRWWEIAAGGVSCLGIHALFALAAERDSTVEDALRLDAAYFPPVCALSALLDSLSDHYSDVGTANHSFTARYRDSAEAATRFAVIANDAALLTARLRHPHRHKVILAGIAVFYLSSSSVGEGFPVPVAERLVRQLGPVVRPMQAIMRLRRNLHARSNSPAAEYSTR
jgi:hypothetical protein